MQKTWILTLAVALSGGVATANAAEGRAPTAEKPIEEIVVTGRAREFYLNRSPSLGNKFPADLRAIPQSIQILPEQLIKDQAAVEITDLYRNISSVSVFSYSALTFRGFRQNEIRYDGLRGDPFSGVSVPLLFDIESVEIIEGPSGALFGGGQPGGVINYVTCAPRDQFSASLSAVGGSLDLHGGRGEVNGPLDQHGRWLMRLGGAKLDAAAIGQRDQAALAGRGVVIGGQHESRVTMPQGRANREQEQAGGAGQAAL